MSTLGERARRARENAGLSQTELADSTGMSSSYVSLIETGRRTPSPAMLEVLASRLGVSAEYLAAGESATAETRVRLAVAQARERMAAGEPKDAVGVLTALELSTVEGSIRLAALRALAEAHRQAGDLAQAATVYEGLLKDALVRDAFPLQAAEIATYAVATYVDAGDLTRAVDLGEEAIARLSSHAIRGSEEHLRLASSLVRAYIERGDLLYATVRSAELITLAEKLDGPRGRGAMYWTAGLLARERGDLPLAVSFMERAVREYSGSPTSRELPRFRTRYAWLLLHTTQPQPTAALTQLTLAREEVAGVGTPVDKALIDVTLAVAYLRIGALEPALINARAGLRRLNAAGTVSLDLADAHLVLGEVLAALGHTDEAQVEYQEAASILTMLGNPRRSARAWQSLGEFFERIGDLPAALTAYRTGLAAVSGTLRDASDPASHAPSGGPSGPVVSFVADSTL